MSKKIALSTFSVLIALGLVISVAVTAAFAAYSLFGEASIVSGGNPGMALQTVSDNDPAFGGASFDDVNGIMFSALSTLSTDYNVTDDDCGAGSPRFAIKIDVNGNGTYEQFPGGDGNIVVHFGPSPSFTGCATGWQSTGNLIGNTDTGRYDSSQVGGSGFGTYTDALAAAGTKNILGINLLIDSSWSSDATNGDGEQTVLFDNVTINSNTYDFEPTPTPTPGPFDPPAECSGISGLGAPIIGTNGSDNINGTSGNDLIFAQGGSDKVDGKGGDDCIVGGAGSDKLIGNGGNDVILAGDGSDSVTGDNGADDLYGGAGSDSLKGGNGSDDIFGEAGSDSMHGDDNNDNLDGGAGSDSAKGGNGNGDTCNAESENSCEL